MQEKQLHTQEGGTSVPGKVPAHHTEESGEGSAVQDRGTAQHTGNSKGISIGGN